MTPLRQRMREDMQLRGFAARTQEAYLYAVTQLARYYHKPPDTITEDELRQFFLYLVNVKHVARATHTIFLCGIKFFFERTLGRRWSTFEILRPPRQHKLPVILSVEQHESSVPTRVGLFGAPAVAAQAQFAAKLINQSWCRGVGLGAG